VIKKWQNQNGKKNFINIAKVEKNYSHEGGSRFQYQFVGLLC